jgi:hypothetical protein
LGESRRWGGVKLGTRLVDSRAIETKLPPAKAFRPVERIGGDTGWYYADWLWEIRGLLDLLVGGAGTRRGRRDPSALVPGDTVDFWRVEAFEPGEFLRLHAEMKLPGRAWLQFEAQENEQGSTTLRQTAVFDPDGLLGLMYWYGLYPLHGMIFHGMLEAIVREGERLETPTPETLDHVA